MPQATAAGRQLFVLLPEAYLLTGNHLICGANLGFLSKARQYSD